MNKKQGSIKKNKLSGVYKRPSSKRLHFSATDNIKEARRDGNCTIHELDCDIEEQQVNKISKKISEKTPCYHIDDRDDSFRIERDSPDKNLLDNSLGYSVFKRAVYDDVKRRALPLARQGK